jgi:hypothetical protein
MFNDFVPPKLDNRFQGLSYVLLRMVVADISCIPYLVQLLLSPSKVLTTAARHFSFRVLPTSSLLT